MSLKLKQGERSDFQPLPEGQYTARCYQVIDLGTQETQRAGESKLQAKIMVTWEVLDDPKMTDGRPFAISKQYTASLDERSYLYKDLVSWRGKAFTADELLGFDISDLVGAYCQVQVIHNEYNGNTYANINTIMGTKERPEAVNTDVIFDINNPDMEVFDNLPDWIKDKIRNSEEWQSKENNKVYGQEPLDIEVEEKTKQLTKEVEDEPINLDDIPF